MGVSILFLILMIACVVQSQYYYYGSYYPYYYNPYVYQQLYPHYPFYYYQPQFPSQFFPAFPATTTPRSTTFRFGIFPEGFVNFDLLGTDGLSRGLLIGRAAGALIQTLVGK